MNRELLVRFAHAIGWRPETALTAEERAKLLLEIAYDDLIEQETAPKIWDESVDQ